MEALELCENISGNHFAELIKYCFSRSDLFTLTRDGGYGKPEERKQDPVEEKRNWKMLREIMERYGSASQEEIEEMEEMIENPGKMYERHDRILSAFDECRIETFTSAQWFSGKIAGMEIDLYPASDKARDILLAHYDNFYLQSGKRMVVLPADLCFFRNGSCWLGSCSHEYYCYALPENEEDASTLMKYGVWRQVKDAYPREELLLTSKLLAELRKS